MTDISASQQRVADVLTRHGIAARIVTFDASTRTASDAAAAIGCDVAQIAKSIILKTRQTSQLVLVVTSGRNRVCEKSVTDLVGEKVGRADADFVREKTGFAIGGVAPVAHLEAPVVLIDEDLLTYPELWAAAGTPNSVFRLTPEELVALTAGRVARIKEESAA
ncbi:YbaK/EbsC family protein [Silvimonas amylolytica]|uniref:Cys-tRNA(Pro)/cys-tRNA(Cys) deacylase n=1 Tax=Silvimonas amylolytica TaxID=449663 RepID=A0ABQ2PP29_9NEIS|nr:YbaK/EbsC family protein [Silvimonas amylolytica]GGP27000.1 cys-tRNA(pro)/cys-tRNA(cys) deacylase [Silvimonas amylolytica]